MGRSQFGWGLYLCQRDPFTKGGIEEVGMLKYSLQWCYPKSTSQLFSMFETLILVDMTCEIPDGSSRLSNG